MNCDCLTSRLKKRVEELELQLAATRAKLEKYVRAKWEDEWWTASPRPPKYYRQAWIADHVREEMES